MLSLEDKMFMSSEMKIDMKHLDAKLNENHIRADKNKIEKAISLYIKEITDQNELGVVPDRFLDIDSEAERKIDSYTNELLGNLTNNSSWVVLDSIRNVFCSYAFNGLHQLFTRQVNEVWHPKIVLDEILEPNDIEKLPNIITIYRGTDRE